MRYYQNNYSGYDLREKAWEIYQYVNKHPFIQDFLIKLIDV